MGIFNQYRVTNLIFFFHQLRLESKCWDERKSGAPGSRASQRSTTTYEELSSREPKNERWSLSVETQLCRLYLLLHTSPGTVPTTGGVILPPGLHTSLPHNPTTVYRFQRCVMTPQYQVLQQSCGLTRLTPVATPHHHAPLLCPHHTSSPSSW